MPDGLTPPPSRTLSVAAPPPDLRRRAPSTPSGAAPPGRPQRPAAVSFDPPLHLDLLIAWKADGYLSRADRAFVDFLLERAGEEGRETGGMWSGLTG